jgi:hypothetical protein
MPDKKTPSDLIWVTQAMVEYGHGRGWYTERIKDGRLHTYPQPGETKVYLSRSEIEEQQKRSA